MELIDALRRHYYTGPDGEFCSEEVLAAHGTAIGALLYAQVFCPPVEEIDGMVLIKLQEAMADDETARAVRQSSNQVNIDLQELQRSFNRVEPLRLFAIEQPDITDEEEKLLIEILSESWRAWLHWKYPGRRFVVESMSREETGGDLGITFYEVI